MNLGLLSQLFAFTVIFHDLHLSLAFLLRCLVDQCAHNNNASTVTHKTWISHHPAIWCSYWFKKYQMVFPRKMKHKKSSIMSPSPFSLARTSEEAQPLFCRVFVFLLFQFFCLQPTPPHLHLFFSGIPGSFPDRSHAHKHHSEYIMVSIYARKANC